MQVQYQEDVSELHRILRKGIEELCNHAKSNGFLEFPYGRKPDPTPLITEEDFINALGGPDCDDAEPPFVYNYGFDPLKMLSDYIIWAHPRTVEGRRQAKLAAQARLEFRAHHAQKQLETQQRLVERIGQMQAGIEWGPLGHAESGNKIVVTLQPLKPSTVYVQAAEDAQFKSIVHTIRVIVVGPSLLTQVELPRLAAGCPYFVRSFAVSLDEQGLEEPSPSHCAPLFISEFDEEYSNVADRWRNAFASLVWTLPIEGEADLVDPSAAPLDPVMQLSFIGQLPTSFLAADAIAGRKAEAEADPRQVSDLFMLPQFTFLLGDLLAHADHSYSSDPLPRYLSQLTGLFARMLAVADLGVLRRGSLLFAWRDSHPLSGHNLRLEEVGYRAHRHELKKYYKKYGLDEPGAKVKPKAKNAAAPKANAHIPPPPPLKIPQHTMQQQAIMQAFPVVTKATEASTSTQLTCRQLYFCKNLSPDVLLVSLDLRRGLGKQAQGVSDYLGKDQAEWLALTLKQARATWKVLVCGKSFGLAAFEETVLTTADASADPAPITPVTEGAESKSVEGAADGADVRVGEEGEDESAQALAASASAAAAQANANNLYDDADEVYGRSKYSLQHVLAEVQRKQAEGTQSSALPALIDLQPFETVAPENSATHLTMHLTSGIVLLTSGVTSFVSRTFHPAALSTSLSEPSVEGGQPAPPAAQPASRPNTSSASSLGSSAGPQYTVAYSSVEDIATPCYVAAYESLQGRAVLPVPIRPAEPSGTYVGFCAEVSLGTGAELPVTSSTCKQWKLLPGLAASTHMLTQPEVQAQWQGDHVVTADLQVLANNSLYVDIYAVPLSPSAQRCKLGSLSLGVASARDDASDSSQPDTLHVA